MKMAKASEADIDMAMELCGAIDALTSRWPTLPTGLCKPADDEPDEDFDCDDDRQCGTVLRHLLAIAERASLLRVVWGCAVMLDPANRLVDPAADTIDRHPDDVANEKDAERYRWLRAQHWNDSLLAVVADPKDAVKLGHDCPSLDRLDAAIDAAMLAQRAVGAA